MTAQPTLIACSPALPYVCETCGSACADAIHAPGEWVGGDAVYRYEPGPMECSRCSRTTWRARLEQVRARRMLIQVSAWVGYPARMADVERLRTAGEQLVLGAM